MNKRYKLEVLSSLFLIIFLFISGCSDNFSNLSPKEAVIKANENLKQTSGYRVNLNATFQIGEIKQNITFKGEAKNPDVVHLTGDFLGMELEIYQKGSEFFIKDPFTQKWSKSQDLNLSNMKDVIKTPGDAFNDIGDLIQDAIYLPDEKIDNIDCKVIKYTLEKDKVKKIMVNGGSKNIKDIIKYTFQIWIGKRDFLIHKIKIMTDLNIVNVGRQSVTITTNLYDFNDKDINIQIPPEVFDK